MVQIMLFGGVGGFMGGIQGGLGGIIFPDIFPTCFGPPPSSCDLFLGCWACRKINLSDGMWCQSVYLFDPDPNSHDDLLYV